MTQPGGHNLLQHAGGSDFSNFGTRHRHSRVSVPTRGSETERHLTAAPSARVRFDCDDLDSLVATFPYATAGRSLAELPTGD